MSNKTKIIGDKIKFFRESAGIGKLELCKILNITDKTLKKYEETGVVPSDVLFRIAEYFDKNPMIFLSNESQNYIKEPGTDYKLNTLKNEVDELKKQVDSLTKIIGAVTAENFALKEENESLRQSNNQLGVGASQLGGMDSKSKKLKV